MTRRSLRFRLTVWYLTALSAGIIVFGLLVWETMNVQLVRNREEGLDRRLDALAQFLEREALGNSNADIQEEAREFSSGLPEGHGLQLFDSRGILLFAHPGTGSEALSRRKSLTVRGMKFLVELSAPLSDYHRTLTELRWVLVFSLPVVLVLAGGMGWWLAGLSLRPVDAMTREAQAIHAGDLAARLTLPGTGDELQRLAEAWNALLGRIEKSVLTVTRFTADAAHELRTPLAVIRTTSELTLRQDRSADAYRKAISSILSETESMTDLIEQLLLLAREDSGQWQFEFDAIRLGDTLRSLQETIVPLAAARRIRVSWELPTEEPLVWADETAVRRVVLILVDNALKYASKNGTVCVRLASQASGALLEVEDDGPGIATEHLPHIFERFYRADPARTAGEGAGLGLAIAKTIVDAHHGTIEVKSNPRAGTLVRVAIPSIMQSRAGARHLVHS